MRRVDMRVRADDVNTAYDRLLPHVRGGLHPMPGADEVVLVALGEGDELPAPSQLAQLAGDVLLGAPTERDAGPDLATALAELLPSWVIGGRVVLYHDALEVLEQKGEIRRPIIPAECQHNAHMYYVLLDSLAHRTQVINNFKKQNIHPVFHYVPLHNSLAGKKFARAHGDLKMTESVSDRILRLPLWIGLDDEMINEVLEVLGVSLQVPPILKVA